MFQGLIDAITSLALDLATLGVAAAALGFVVLALMNYFSILDPRLGAQVKMGLIKVILSSVFLGMGAGITTLAKTLASSGGGG